MYESRTGYCNLMQWAVLSFLICVGMMLLQRSFPLLRQGRIVRTTILEIKFWTVRQVGEDITPEASISLGVISTCSLLGATSASCSIPGCMRWAPALPLVNL